MLKNVSEFQAFGHVESLLYVVKTLYCSITNVLKQVQGGMVMPETNVVREEDRKFGKQVLGREVVSKSGKKFGVVGDVVFEVKSGELIHIVLKSPTQYADRLELEKSKEGQALIPYSAVMAVGDMVVVSEEDIV